MCGIAGWVDLERDLGKERAVITAMTATLASRGPDDSGIWLSRHAALGHRRLVVVDPAGGRQPMVRRRGEKLYVLPYNGELYNTEDLRGDLRAGGYSFQGHPIPRSSCSPTSNGARLASSGSTASSPLASGTRRIRSSSWPGTA